MTKVFSYSCRCVLAVLSVFLLISCAESTPPPDPGVLPGVSPSVQFAFPHPAGSSAPEIHGKWYHDNGFVLCEKCHGMTDPKGKSPACRSCHELFPHDEGWSDVAKHGEGVRARGVLSCTTKCHGRDLNGGLSQVACSKCHRSYPHSAGWSVVDKHGVEALGDKKLACRSCHGNDFAGGSSGVPCFKCHKDFPHLANWGNKDQHGAYVMGAGSKDCKSACHGVDLKGGASGVSCTKCHDSFPHPDGWRVGDGHGRVAKGDGKLTCRVCHGFDYAGGRSGVSCAKEECHPAYPHIADAWVLVDGGLHSATYRDRMKEGKAAVCTNCHGLDYGGGRSGVTCKRAGCHAADFGHPLDIPPDQWRQIGHGAFFVARGFKSSAVDAPCWSCHGAPIVFKASYVAALPIDNEEKRQQEKDFLKGKSDCYRCHWAFPHIGWENAPNSTIWEPVVPNQCLQEPRAQMNFAHSMYVAGSQLLTDAAGVGIDNANPDMLASVLLNTCGGRGGGLCHTGGRLSYRLPGLLQDVVCGNTCHKQALPIKPPLPDCEPPVERLSPQPPQVSNVVPANNAVNVALNTTTVSIRFNEAMRRDTVLAAGTIIVRKQLNGEMVAGELSCGNDWCIDATVRNLRLEPGTVYEIAVSMAAEDWAGVPMNAPFVSQFTMAVPDLVPPAVQSTTPANNVVIADLPNDRITIVFSEPIVSPSAQENRYPPGSVLFRLRRQRNNAEVPGVFRSSCVPNSMPCATMYFSPRNPLVPGEAYNAEVMAIIKDPAGNRLQVPYRWSFALEDE